MQWPDPLRAIRPVQEKGFIILSGTKFNFCRLFCLIAPPIYYSLVLAAQDPALSAKPQHPLWAPSAQHGFGQSSLHGVFGQSVDSVWVAIIWVFTAADAIIGQPVPAAGQAVAGASESFTAGLMFV
jgi:hypothetical protein